MKALVIEKTIIVCEPGSIVEITADQAKRLGNRVQIQAEEMEERAPDPVKKQTRRSKSK